MLKLTSSIAFVLSNADEISFFSESIKKIGYKEQTYFTDSKAACEVALKKQFDMFVVRQEMPQMSGVVFIQKLRESMNYGAEQHFFIANEITPAILNILLEFDVNYILTRPFTPDRILQKFQHMVRTESALPEPEKDYREAKLLFANGLLDDALERTKSALQKHVGNEKLTLLAGDIAFKLGKLDEAKVAFESARQLNPTSVLASQKLGMSYMAEKDFERANKLLDALTELNPYNIDLLTNAGISNFELGKVEKAKQQLGQVKKLDETNKESGEVMAKIHIQEGNYGALAQTLSASHSDKELISFLNNAGIKLSKADDVEGALAMYKSTLEHVKESQYLYAIYYNMGVGYQKLKNYPEAQKYYKLTLDLKPDFEKAAAALKTLP